ncbi:RelA/SpoT domain-containing protein [Massilia sp. RP-1-19]|uniref:RelA/SpoT domain-containing protein n=1 Tax=Massilia polaris TaxID=2728846 RepID=A0A848HKJ2_9BURK|nr:RelA/SpoT domain-containing protein [Massilia polaris]NML60710.1 RelA/SpoT domain-containing protein [Massilia polaris]
MYSGKAIIKAGEKLLDADLINTDPAAYSEAMDILSYWRFSHEKPLEIAFNILQNVAQKKDKSTIFAKRLKRYVSIVAKLRRYDTMKLRNMQDIGGCRAIVSNEKRLRQLVRELRKRPEFKVSTGKIKSKDYIKNPKDDGYRGYHLIGAFGESSEEMKSIEIQVRTSLQHDWATALEIVDLFTGQALKSNQGNADWKKFFRSVSEQFAVMESIHLFDTLTDAEKYENYEGKILARPDLIEACRVAQEACVQLDVITKFNAFAQSLNIINERLSEVPVTGYALIEVDTKKRQVSSSLYSDDMNAEAEARYIKCEKIAAETPHRVVALVSTTAVGGIKEAYPNYFADSTDFLQHLWFVTAVNLPAQRNRSFLQTLQRLLGTTRPRLGQ